MNAFWRRRVRMRDGKLVIHGSMDAVGGEYDKVKVHGSATITGDVVTEKVGVYGQATFMNAVQAEFVKVHGSLDINGGLTAEKLSIYGTAEVDRVARVKVCKNRGQLELNEDFHGSTVDNKGRFDARGNVSVDQFTSVGSCKINGLLTAESIMLKLAHTSRIREIGGDKVVVRRARFSRSAKLKIDLIEADDIYLENTIADVVRGKVVRIGPGCKIGIVEYREDATVSRNSTVGEMSKQ